MVKADGAILFISTTAQHTSRYQVVGNFRADGGRKEVPLNLKSKLAQLSSLIKEVSREIDRPREVETLAAHHPSMPSASKDQDAGEESDDHQPAPVVVLGPPGTEPRKGVSEGRFDRLGSVVYSRTSTEVALPQQHTSSLIRVTQPKDFVPRTEVVEVDKRDDVCGDRPWTRSGTKMLTVMRNVDKKSPYVEDSDSSDLEESDEDSLLRPLHGKVPRASGRQAGPQVRTAAAERSSAGPESDTTTDSRVRNTTSEDISDYDTAPEWASEKEEGEVNPERGVVEDRLTVSPVTVTVYARSVPSAPSAKHTLPTPSGLLTVLNELQRSYGGLKGLPGMKPHSKAAGVNAKKRLAKSAARVTKRNIRPCSVRVPRLSRETVQKYTKRDKPSQGILSSSMMELDSSYEPLSSPSLDTNEMLGPTGYDSPCSPPGADDSDSSLKVVTASCIESSDREAAGGGNRFREGRNSSKGREDESRCLLSGSPTPTPTSPGRVKPSTPAKPSSGPSVRRNLHVSLSQCWSSDSDFDNQPKETPPQLRTTSRVSLPGVQLTPGSAAKGREKGGGGVKKGLAGDRLRGADTNRKDKVFEYRIYVQMFVREKFLLLHY